MARPISQNHKGERSGRLTALRNLGGRKWLFKCDCGNQKIIPACSVFRKTGRRRVQSCGCLYDEIMKKGGFRKTHGLSGTKFYKSWGSMHSRCYRKKDPRYKYYSAKGIKVLWKTFEDFKKDMYASFLRHSKLHGNRQTTLDRINVYGHY